MAADNDQRGWLPEPPPARPARREAAIESALRRFDGVGEPAAAKPRASTWSRRHRPQLAFATSAMLVLVLAVPATLVGLRERESVSGDYPPAQVAQESSCVGEDCGTGALAMADAAPAPDAGTAEPPAATAPLQRGEARMAAAGESAADAAPPPAAAPPPVAPMMAAPPPAAPPPPPPPPAPQRSEQMAAREDSAAEQNIVVTGSRVARPSLATEDGFNAMSAAPSGAAPAADRYQGFLSQLQAAMRANDRRAVIALIRFPLRVSSGGTSHTYRDARTVDEDFEQIFTPRVRQAILGQRAERLRANGRDAAIGNGIVRIAQSCPNAECSPPGPVRIVAVSP